MGKGGGKDGSFVAEWCMHSIFCALFILIIGPLFLLLGSVALASALDDVRGQKINEYNGFVDAWQDLLIDADPGKPNKAAAYRAGANFTYTLESSAAACGGGAAEPHALSLDTTNKDKLLDGLGDGAHPMTLQRRFSAQHHFGHDVDPYRCSLNVNFGYWARDEVTGDEHHVPLRSVPTYLAQETRFTCSSNGQSIAECSRHCAREGGKLRTVDGGLKRCVINTTLKTVCIKVRWLQTSDGGSWQVDLDVPTSDDRDLNGGCFYGPAFTKDNKRVEVFSEDRFAHEEPSTKTAKGMPVDVVVRYSADPWLHYMKITDATGKFGLSVGQKLMLGVCFLVLGVIITIAQVRAFTYFCYYRHNPDAARPCNGDTRYYYDWAMRYPARPVDGYPMHEAHRVQTNQFAPHISGGGPEAYIPGAHINPGSYPPPGAYPPGQYQNLQGQYQHNYVVTGSPVYDVAQNQAQQRNMAVPPQQPVVYKI